MGEHTVEHLHYRDGRRVCEGFYCAGCALVPRPTVQVMDGETGETALDNLDTYDTRACSHWDRVAPWEATRIGWVTAPTPRTP